MTNTDTEESRDVLHFHYTTWPDFGVPSCPDTFLEFLGAVRESGSLDSSEGPAVVHCSAGIGRSGSFILVDSCLLEAETEGPETVNIKQRLLDMRTFRMGLIQTEDQLKFSYQAIIEVNQTGCCSQPIRDDYLQGARQLDLISLVPSLEAAVAEASGSSEDEDVPPPLPPPRTESLRRPASEDRELAGHVKLEEALAANGRVQGTASSSSTDSSSVENSPNKCILTSGKLEEKKR